MPEILDCSICAGEMLYLGALGSREYYSCRNCGAEIGRDTDSEPTLMINIQIDCAGDSFAENPGAEIAQILGAMAREIAGHFYPREIGYRDTCGNRCGFMHITEKR